VPPSGLLNRKRPLGAELDKLVDRIALESRTLEEISFRAGSKPPRAARAMVYSILRAVPSGGNSLVQSDKAPGDGVRVAKLLDRHERPGEELLTDPPEELESSGRSR
jgi:hypothetical protein